MSTPHSRYSGKRKTCRRENTPGHAHALTFCCFQHKPFLTVDRSRRWFLDALSAAREKHSFDLWAYVIMPEHVHLLILPLEEHYSISAILSDLKRPVARQALRYVQEHKPEFLAQMRDEQPNGKIAHRFWQRGGGYDRNLASTKYIHSTIDYLHANPVRCGLVDSPQKWPWSSASFFAGCEDVLIRPDVGTIPSSTPTALSMAALRLAMPPEFGKTSK